jgi:hypothetical protein
MVDCIVPDYVARFIYHRGSDQPQANRLRSLLTVGVTTDPLPATAQC